ncbi:hypothetical protein [Pseudomonas sp. CGJS7]|uniref:hypothetical protein n=1 Tax=Pseudomonas sp. CGJS7 TaxID=3109348 RepID=UPI00300B13D7
MSAVAGAGIGAIESAKERASRMQSTSEDRGVGEADRPIVDPGRRLMLAVALLATSSSAWGHAIEPVFLPANNSAQVLVAFALALATAAVSIWLLSLTPLREPLYREGRGLKGNPLWIFVMLAIVGVHFFTSVPSMLTGKYGEPFAQVEILHSVPVPRKNSKCLRVFRGALLTRQYARFCMPAQLHGPDADIKQPYRISGLRSSLGMLIQDVELAQAQPDPAKQAP